MRRSMVVKSMQGAIALIGERTLRKWLSLMMLSYIADDKPQELLRLALLRARFCEQVGDKLGKGRDFSLACYTLGMFSLLDVMLDQPMEKILKELNLAPEIVDTLTAGKKTRYSVILSLAKAYERGDWLEVARLAGSVKEVFEDLPLVYAAALDDVRGFYAV